MPFTRSWCYNLATLEATQLAFADAALGTLRLGGKVMLVKPDGLYPLGGTTDAGAGIRWRFTLSPNAYGSDMMKRCGWIHGGVADVASVFPVLDGKEKTGNRMTQGRHNARRASLPKALVNNFWAFRFVGIGPNQFSWVRPAIEPLPRRF